MQIVISMQEDDYRKVQDGRASVSMMRKAIRNGTPLPKGHGRLIDEDQIPGDGGWDFSDRLMSTQTIIETDKGKEQE